MTPCAEDFKISADYFCLKNPWNTLRILCGAWFFPHALSKFSAGGLNPATVGFFAEAGFSPAQSWVVLAAVSELAVGLLLVLGLATRFSALAAVAILWLAAVALSLVAGVRWFWNGGGIEYLIFWSLMCLLVAQHAWQQFKHNQQASQKIFKAPESRH